jgi:hypothetical protein
LKILISAVFLICAAASSVANANLIVNGSFEENAIASGKWSWFDSASVTGWQGSNVEIWHAHGGFQAQHGSQIAELNAHGKNSGAFSIFQEFTTVVGSVYEVSFHYAARSSNNESFLFKMSSPGMLFTKVIDDHVVKQWSTYTAKFKATDTTSNIRFTTITPESGTVGNFIDNVEVNAVSAPATAILMLLGLAAVFVRRAKLLA